jgi:hypothetical protein
MPSTSRASQAAMKRVHVGRREHLLVDGLHQCDSDYRPELIGRFPQFARSSFPGPLDVAVEMRKSRPCQVLWAFGFAGLGICGPV